MPIDFSEFSDNLSGSKNMKKFVETVEKRLSRKLNIPIIIKPEGIPYLLNLIVWEICAEKYYEDGSVLINLKMYPAGFSNRYHSDVDPHINTIVESIQKDIVNSMVDRS